MKAEICTHCGGTDDVIDLDGEEICRSCLFNNEEPVRIYPLGYIRNDHEMENGVVSYIGEKGTSRIELIEGQERFLHAMEDEEYLTIVFYMHGIKRVRSTILRRNDLKEVGIYASRGPGRPSRIAVTEVKLIRVEGR
ncbi:MAG: SAM-dependent methyltransferase, partial [Thermoplasmata archaeon]|nr:SAM-dependent methyltransferase [Thermoplasmata archaeon]